MKVGVRVGAGQGPSGSTETSGSGDPGTAGAMVVAMMAAGIPAGAIEINIDGEGWAPLIGLYRSLRAADCTEMINKARPARLESRDAHLNPSLVAYVDPADLDGIDEAREAGMAELSDLIARGAVPPDNGSRYWVALVGDRFYPALQREQWSLGEWRITSTHSEVNPAGVDVNGEDWRPVWGLPGSRHQPVDDDHDDCVDVRIGPGLYAEPMSDEIWLHSDEGTGYIRIASPGGLCANILDIWERWLRRH